MLLWMKCSTAVVKSWHRCHSRLFLSLKTPTGSPSLSGMSFKDVTFSQVGLLKVMRLWGFYSWLDLRRQSLVRSGSLDAWPGPVYLPPGSIFLSLLPDHYEARSPPPLRPSTVLLLCWSLLKTDWNFWDCAPKQTSPPLNCGCLVLCPWEK